MPSPSVKIGKVAKVVHYNAKKQSGIFLVQPVDWEKGQLKVMGNFGHEPNAGEMIQVDGVIEKEPWLEKDTGKPMLSANGKELYNYVMKNAKIKEPGEAMSLIGRVERVFHATEKSSIVLVRPDGWKSPIKVFAPTMVNEGDMLTAEGFKDKVPYLKDGKPVNGEDGTPIFNTVLRATSAESRAPKEYSGPISKVISYNEETHNAIVLFNPGFKNNKEVKAYINIEEKPIVGANMSIMGITDNEISEKDGQTYNNLVIRAASCYQSPADSATEGMNENAPDNFDDDCVDMDASGDFMPEDDDSASPTF